LSTLICSTALVCSTPSRQLMPSDALDCRLSRALR
jgi:hypothetical protein